MSWSLSNKRPIRLRDQLKESEVLYIERKRVIIIIKLYIGNDIIPENIMCKMENIKTFISNNNNQSCIVIIVICV